MPILKIESTTDNLPKQKVPGQNGFTGEFFETFKEEIITTHYYLFSEIGSRGNTS